MQNLARAIQELPHVLAVDNGDLLRPFRDVAAFERGKLIMKLMPLQRGHRGAG